MKVLGSTTKWKALASSIGLMIAVTKVNISMIRKKVMVYSTGMTDESMMDSGKMENSMDKESTLIPRVSYVKEPGKTERESNGLKRSQSD